MTKEYDKDEMVMFREEKEDEKEEKKEAEEEAEEEE